MHEQRVRATTTKSGAIIAGSTLTIGSAVAQAQAFTTLPVTAGIWLTVLDAGGSVWASLHGIWDGSTTFTVDQIGSTSAGYGASITLTTGTHDAFLDISADQISAFGISSDFYPDRFIAGLALPSSAAGLIGTITAGTAQVIGRRVDLGVLQRTWTASKNTFCDLDYRGNWTFTAVTSPTVPSVAVNSIRRGYVTCDGTHITGATDLGNPLPFYIAQIINSASQTIASAATTYLTFDTELLLNDAGMHSSSSNTGRLVATKTAVYELEAFLCVNGNNATAGVTDRVFAQIERDDGKIIAGSGGNMILYQGYPTFSLKGTDYAVIGNYYRIAVYQTGAATDTYNDSSTQETFTMRRMMQP